MVNNDLGASVSPTGPSQAEPEVSALRASVPCAIYVRFSDDNQHIRKWSPKPFEGATAYLTAAARADMWWDPNNPERPLSDPFEDIGEWDREHGHVHEVWQGQRLHSIYVAALEPADDADSDDDWTVEAITKSEAEAALMAETERRAASGIAARSDETPTAAQPEGQEPGGAAETPESPSQ